MNFENTKSNRRTAFKCFITYLDNIMNDNEKIVNMASKEDNKDGSDMNSIDIEERLESLLWDSKVSSRKLKKGEENWQ